MLREIRAAIQDGELTADQAPMAALHRLLKARGYERTRNALILHLKAHDHELYALIRPGD